MGHSNMDRMMQKYGIAAPQKKTPSSSPKLTASREQEPGQNKPLALAKAINQQKSTTSMADFRQLEEKQSNWTEKRAKEFDANNRNSLNPYVPEEAMELHDRGADISHAFNRADNPTIDYVPSAASNVENSKLWRTLIGDYSVGEMVDAVTMANPALTALGTIKGVSGLSKGTKAASEPALKALKSLVAKTPVPVKKAAGIGAAVTGYETVKGATDPDYVNPITKKQTLPAQAGASLRAGTGDVLKNLGSVAEWKGKDELGNTLKSAGESVSKGYETEQVPFTWKSFFDPDWYANNVARTAPSTAMLIPLMFAGYKLGGAAAAKSGIKALSGPMGKTIVASLTGTAMSRPMESAMEAGNTYEDAINQGMSEAEAEKAAQQVFNANLKLAGLDAAQLALAFAPAPGKLAAKVGKTGLIAGKLGLETGTEALEEGYQQGVQQQATGADNRGIIEQITNPNPEMQESMAIGGLFGLGMGGAGVVNDMVKTIKARTIENLPDSVMPEVKTRVDEHVANGMTPAEALDNVLDEMAEVPEVAQVISNITQEEAQKVLTTVSQQSAQENTNINAAPETNTEPAEVTVYSVKTGEPLKIVDGSNPEFMVVENNQGQRLALTPDEITNEVPKNMQAEKQVVTEPQEEQAAPVNEIEPPQEQLVAPENKEGLEAEIEPQKEQTFKEPGVNKDEESEVAPEQAAQPEAELKTEVNQEPEIEQRAETTIAPESVNKGDTVYDQEGNALKVVNPGNAKTMRVEGQDGKQKVVKKSEVQAEITMPKTAEKKITKGSPTTAKTERGTKIDVHYALVDADDLVASHTTGFMENKAYPQELQPRDRERTASKVQITRMAQSIEPEFLGESPKASDGAPIVGQDMVVESGNGRVIALQTAYENNETNDSADRYRQYLRDNSKTFGLDAAAIDNINKPVLVRVRTSDVDRVQFAKEANEQSVAAMSASEQAMSDSGKLTQELLNRFYPGENGEILAPSNRYFIQDFVSSVIGPAEQARYVTSDGSISQEGVNRIRNAIFAKAYGDVSVIEKLAESTDNNIKNITNAMLMAAPRFAEINSASEAGNLHDLDITPEIAEAARRMSMLREQGISFDDYIYEQSNGMFGSDLEPLVKDILEAFNQFKRSSKKVFGVLKAYTDGVIALGDPKQGALFGENEVPERSDILNAAINLVEGGESDNGQTSLFESERSSSKEDGKADNGEAEKGQAKGAKVSEPEKGFVKNSQIDILKENNISYDADLLLREGENNDAGRKRLKASIEQLTLFESMQLSNTGRDLARSGGPRTLALSITKEAAKTGRIDLRGKKAATPKRIATLAQVFRNPSFETFRIIYMKGNAIVGHEAVTSRLPGVSRIFIKNPAKEIYEMKQRMKRLGADGYYLLHNHPSGNSNPSKEDIKVTDFYIDEVPGCKGHVIIDSNEYSFYNQVKGAPTLTTEKVDFSKGKQDAILTPSIDHVLLGQKLSSDSALASTAKQIEVTNDMVVIVYTDSPGYVRAIQEVPIGLFNHLEKAADYIRGRSREFGARRAFVASEIQGNSFDAIKELVERGVLQDAVLIKDNGTYETVYGRVANKANSNAQGKWMGKEIPKRGIKVQEKDSDFTREQIEKAPVFFSQLQRTIEEKMPNKAMPMQIAAIIKGGKVKEEEIKWSGIMDWLRTHEGKVSKDEVLDYLRANDVQVEEKTYGKPVDTSGFDPKNPDAFVFEEFHSPRYDQYQLPGGENYRELLFTMPPNPTREEVRPSASASAPYKEEWDKLTQELRNTSIIHGASEEARLSSIKRNQIEQKMEELHDKMIDATIKEMGGLKSNYQSGHWSEPNVLAHVRFNDRTGANGEKILHIEEVQSDWHQSGRKHGYQNDGQYPRGWEVKKNQYNLWTMFDETGENVYTSRQPNKTDAEKEFQDFLKYMREEVAVTASTYDRVPDAPFKTTWHEFVMKRMIRYAAENGYDRITWTTGQQQAARYDLSKQIDRVDYNSGSKQFIATRGNRRVIEKDNVNPEDLEDIIGKEVAKKLLENKKWDNQAGGSSYFLEGMDLKVGGEGMKGFYDRMIPAFLNKYAKKWGAKVEESIIETANAGWDIADIHGGSYGTYASEQSARDHILEIADKYAIPLQELLVKKVHGNKNTVHSLPITDTMRNSVLYEGQPKFKKAPEAIQLILDEASKELGWRKKWAPGAMKSDRFQAANELSKALTGNEIITYTSIDSEHGFSLGGRVFLNARSRQPTLYVTSHEITHTMQVNSPEHYDRLMDIIVEHIGDNSGITRHYLSHKYEKHEIPDELAADVLAECMVQPTFWQRVRNEAPELLKSILDIIDRILAVARKQAQVPRKYQIMQYMKDVELMQQRLAEVYADYLQSIGETPVGITREAAAKAKSEGAITGKLPQRYKPYGVGKDIGGKVYLHKMYEDVLPANLLKAAKAKLPDGFDYTGVAYDRKTGQFTFTYSPDFDTASEPTVGEQYAVFPDGKVRHFIAQKNPQIWHHKWLWVKDDYPGFDVAESKLRSEEWMAIPNVDKSRIGYKDYWEKNVVPLLSQQLKQSISSADTSLNQVASTFKSKFFTPGELNIDIGGGKYDKGTEFLRDNYNTENLIFDPFNRDSISNRRIIERIKSGEKGDTVTVNNVLNVIAEPEVRANVIKQAAKSVKDDGTSYFLIYEGNGTGAGKETTKGWQNNRKAQEYIQEVRQHFNKVERKGNLIIATGPKNITESAAWETGNGQIIRFKHGSKFTLEDPDIEARMEAACGVPQETMRQRIAEMWEEIKRKTREYEYLPRTGQFSELRKSLLQLRKAKGIAGDKTLRILNDITKPLDDYEYSLFTKKVIMDDLAHEAEEGHLLPFGFTPESLESEKARVDEAVKQNSKVANAVQKRKQEWTKIKDTYINACHAIGFKVEDRLKKEDYYRHQVLEHALTKGVTGSGRKLRTPSGRGFLKQREGSSFDINTDYLQAEYEVMAQMLYDTAIVDTIKVVKKHYDVMNQLKRQAVQTNNEKMLEYFAGMIEKFNLHDTDPGKMYRQLLNKKQAIALGDLERLAANGELPVDSAGRFKPVIQYLADSYLTKKMGDKGVTVLLDSELNEEQYHKEFFAYLNWLTKGEEGQAKIIALTVYKGMAEKQRKIKNTLGKDYVTWSDLVPEGYSIWQPREGNMFYMADSIPERIAEALYSGILEEAGITGDMLKKVMIMGQKFPEMVLPDEVVLTLDNLYKNADQEGPVAKFYHTAIRAWKQWQLLFAKRYFKYNVRNLTGDLDAVIGGNPSAMKKVPQAWSDLKEAFFAKDRTMTPELEEWFNRGGFETLLQCQEINDVNRNRMFKHLMDSKIRRSPVETLVNAPKEAWLKYWDFTRTTTDFREALFRYAAYLDYLEQIKKSNTGRPKNFGASNRDEIMGLNDVRDRAFKLSNELLGAYDEVSATGVWLSDNLFPFWRWNEVNFTRYCRLIKNAVKDGDLMAAVGRKVATVPIRGAFMAMQCGKLFLKASALTAIIVLWNKLFFGDADDDLPDDVKQRLHITFGRDKDGNVIYFSRLGALQDFLDWFGMDTPVYTAQNWLSGKRSTKETLIEMVKSPLNKVATGLGPQFSLPLGLGLQVKLFPDATKPGRVRDRTEFLFDSFGLKSEYRELTGKPTSGYGKSIKDIFVYQSNPQETAYYATKDEKARFMKDIHKYSDGWRESEKGEVLYNVKLALRYKDKEAAIRYLQEYVALGGTAKGLQQSLKSMDPLFGLTYEEKVAFIKQLDSEGKENLIKAYEYYSGVINPSEPEED